MKDNEAIQPSLETREQLIKAGFDLFPPARDAVENFQKRYDDDTGKKYFITATLYPPMRHPYTGAMYYPNYTFTIQLYQKGTHAPVNLEFFDSWKVADVEEAAEKIWNTGMWEHYRVWDED